MTTAGGFQRGFLLGIPKENVINVPFGDTAAVEAAIKAESFGNINRVIALIVEPIRGEAAQVPPDGYLDANRTACAARTTS